MSNRSVRRWLQRLSCRWLSLRGAREAGMTTAEYAVGTLAAVAFAVVLLVVIRSGAVQGAVMQIITKALHSGG